MRRIMMVMAAVTPLVAVPAVAQMSDVERFQVAEGLAQVLAGEELCGLSYDQSGISSYIEATVPAEDMQFTSTLGMLTRNAGRETTNMNASQKTIYCTQVERVARAYGFIE